MIYPNPNPEIAFSGAIGAILLFLSWAFHDVHESKKPKNQDGDVPQEKIWYISEDWVNDVGWGGVTVGKKTKIPKRVLYCDVRAVLCSCKVLVLTLGASRCSPFAEIVLFVLHLGRWPNTKADQCTQWGGWMVNNARTHQAAHAGRVGCPGHPPHNGGSWLGLARWPYFAFAHSSKMHTFSFPGTSVPLLPCTYPLKRDLFLQKLLEPFKLT